jgi:hypothetical protein
MDNDLFHFRSLSWRLASRGFLSGATGTSHWQYDSQTCYAEQQGKEAGAEFSSEQHLKDIYSTRI